MTAQPIAPGSEPPTAASPTGSGRHDPVSGRPVWLTCTAEPVYAVMHGAVGDRPVNTAALIMPAFGWDNDCSYRVRRDWATALAQAGIPALRFDLPGTEDSVGSAVAPGRLQSWLDATAAVAHWLAQDTACERIVAAGIGLGGLLAYSAAAAGAEIDDLVLWGVRASGRAYVRELRAYGAVVTGQLDDQRPDGAGSAGPAGGHDDGSTLDIGGHRLSTETATGLSAINLAATPLPDPDRRRVLLVGRDALGVDRALSDSLAAAGVTTTTIETNDYYCAMAPPEVGLTAERTIAASIDWLLQAAPEQADRRERCTGADAEPAPQESVVFSHAGSLIRERHCELQSSEGRLVGIVSEPVERSPAGYCLLVVNSGALRRTGPNRLFVEIARNAAARGVPAARFDFPGLGDSDGTAVRSFERTTRTDGDLLGLLGEIYDRLDELGVADRFVTTGLSLGGYLPILAVLEEPRTIGAISANASTFKWSAAQRRQVLRELKYAGVAGEASLLPASPVERLPPAVRAIVKRLDRVRVSADAFARRHLAQFEFLWRLEHLAEIRDVSRILDRLGASGAGVTLILAELERLRRILEQPKLAAKLERYPNIHVERVPTKDHLLRPLWVQDMVLERVSAALEELAAAPAGRASAAGSSKPPAPTTREV